MTGLRIKIDLGSVFPGAVMLILSIVLFIALGVVVVLAYMFSFIPGAGSVYELASELMLAPMLLLVVGGITILTGLSWWGEGNLGWFSAMTRAKALNDRLALSSRIGEVFGVTIAIVVFLFLYENQLRGVGFFTSEFGADAQFFFYAPLFAGVSLSVSRAITGQRNEIRPFDALNSLFFAVSSFWLLSVFPFEFSQFGSMFPASIQFIFGWVTNDFGRLIFLLGGVVSTANFVYTIVTYVGVRHQLLLLGHGHVFR